MGAESHAAHTRRSPFYSGFCLLFITEVLHLIGEPDFRDVILRWEFGEDDKRPRLLGFQVNYCELQAWGPHRCRTKVRA